jgi:hypothetical protein
MAAVTKHWFAALAGALEISTLSSGTNSGWHRRSTPRMSMNTAPVMDISMQNVQQPTEQQGCDDISPPSDLPGAHWGPSAEPNPPLSDRALA